MNDSESSDDLSAPPTFDCLPLSDDVRKALNDVAYTHPTPVQKAVFEPAMKGKDLVVQARTGTGKTAAFGLPLVSGLIKSDGRYPQTLVLCPTRELALQITREIEMLAKHTQVSVTAVYGGAPMARQVQEMRDGAQIIVGTPGRVLDHLHRGTLQPDKIRVFILDESDEMLSMGFLPQITDIWSMLPPGQQTLLFSATLPPDVQRIAETKLKDPEFITLSGDHIGALEILHFVYVSHGDKLSNLLRVLEIENPESAIIFCNTRDETKKVAAALKQEGYTADWLNADLAQNEREKVMARTRDGKLRFLVATDVAARGIDISLLTHVINHDFPESAEAYVHRTGRTGRAGRTGVAISLIAPGDIGLLYMLRLTYKIFPVERTLPSAREVKSREETDLVTLFVQAFAERRPHPDDLALARRLLTHEKVEVVVAGLLRDHLGARPDALEEAKAIRRAETPRIVVATESSTSKDRPEPRTRSERPRSADKPERQTPSRNNRPNRQEAEATRPQPDNRSARGSAEPIIKRERRNDNGVDERRSKSKPDPETEERSRPTNSKEDNLPESSLEETKGEIFVNVGRKDGAKPSDFQGILEEQGFELDEIDYVRVRQRHTFVGVPEELERRALNALDGAVIRGRKAMAERARPRGN
jgi:ATP-dependent RNA helicase DeaD